MSLQSNTAFTMQLVHAIHWEHWETMDVTKKQESVDASVMSLAETAMNAM